MAQVRIDLDTRKHSKSRVGGLYPIVMRIFHYKTRLLRLGYFTSMEGWDDKNSKLRKSALANRNRNCDEIHSEIDTQLYEAKQIIKELGQSINQIDVDKLVSLIKSNADQSIDSEIKRKVENGVTLMDWRELLISRKRKTNSPATAEWYANCMSAFLKSNSLQDCELDDINVTMLKELEIDLQSKDKSPNTINSYLRGIRALYNKAIEEDKFNPTNNPFDKYKLPSGKKTKKRATSKENFLQIRKLKYPDNSILCHAKNYILIMFNCRGMNLIDLVKLKVESIVGDRLYYGRSKTGDSLSVRITDELEGILDFYKQKKSSKEFLFPINYDGSTENYEKYKSIRRRINERMKIIAEDAGIEDKFTTYSIRHSWATIAKFMGISTEVISEGLGHNSLRTTEIYLKSFENEILDDANEKIVA